jgi:benzoyl-CoA reductase/2-hydroxyglutaryl-CoA dehydratase subunit BcrC/BadD/HgdB
VLPQVICPFARAQVGERLLKENPYYTMLDMVVAPITCQHLKKVIDTWEYFGELEIFKLGVPHQHGDSFYLEYFRSRLAVMQEKLQVFTGNPITYENMIEAIGLYNKLRGLLRNISLMRRNSSLPVSGLDFIKLNHASFYADPVFMVDTLEAVYTELHDKQPSLRKNVPRILLTGPNLGYGDYKIAELVEETGGDIAVEELCEGMRYYWHDIKVQSDLVESFVSGYLVDRVPCAFMRYSTGKRLDFLLDLIKEFQIDGVIWYELLACETYDSESYFFAEKMAEHNIPMLVLESDYGTADTGQIKTRIEAFMEIVKGGV